MPKKKVRTLIVIGGREDKVGDKLILSEVARRIGRGRLVIAAVASKYPGPLFDEYDHVFRSLGLKHVAKLEIHNRCEANDETKIRVLDDAAGVFFTGGDQLRITSQLGDTPVHRRIKDIYESQGLIAGTSAGASVMCETMIVSSGNPHSHKVSDSIKLAPGFGLIGGMIIDQHFSERSRMVRLLGSIAQNPKNLVIANSPGIFFAHKKLRLCRADAFVRPRERSEERAHSLWFVPKHCPLRNRR